MAINFDDDPSAALLAVIILISLFYTTLVQKIQKTPTVQELNIYPIKSAAEVPVKSAIVTPRGFQNDRIFQIVSKVGKLWTYCTPRDKGKEKIFHIRSTFSADGKCLTLSSPDATSTIMLNLESTPTSSLKSTVMGDAEVALKDYGKPFANWVGMATGIKNPRLVGIPEDKAEYDRLVEVNPDQGDMPPPSSPMSLADEAPFLLTTRESLEELNSRLESAKSDAVDMRRFRPNIVINGLEPWEEDSLKRIKIGSVEFNVWQRCGRCTMTTIDRDTLKRGAEPLKTLSTFRERDHGQRNFGMHLIPVLGGDGEECKISLGDKVEILEYDEERRAEWKKLFGGGEEE